MNKRIYQFGEFLLDLQEKRLLRNGQTVPLQPKVFDLLVFFVENHGELLSRDELMQAVWKDTFVEETNLRFCIHNLRKALGKTAERKDFVETVPKRGYRFTSPVSEKSDDQTSEKNVENKTSEVITPQKFFEKTNFPNRHWMIGIAALSIICFVILAVAWQRNETTYPQNILAINQLAVLPFESAGENQTDLQIGLADELITNLSKIRQLKVLPLASIRKFTGQNFDTKTVGKELGADAVFSGSYRLDGENVRVTANLTRVGNGETLWTETITMSRKTGLELESAIALRLARLLSLKIAEIEDEKSLADQNLDPEAVKDFLSARKIWRKGELFRREEMIGLYEKTIVLEPTWALAYASLAEALQSSEEIVFKKEKIQLIVEKAIELDGKLAPPHATLGEMYQLFDWNWEKAEAELKEAIRLNPDYALAHYKYARLLMRQRRFSEAEEELNTAVRSDPFSPLFHTGLCELYTMTRKFDKALSACHYAEQIEPEFWQTPKLLFWIYIEANMYQELSEMILGGLSPEARAKHHLTLALAQQNLRSYWLDVIGEPSRTENQSPLSLAMFYLQIGEKEKALDLIEIALKQKDLHLPLINAEIQFDSIRDEPRFVEVMRKIGLQR